MSFLNYFEPKRVLNKWQFFFQCFPDTRYAPENHIVRIMLGACKFKRFLKSGEIFGREHYVGFYKDFNIKIWL